jgi:hypothetical protein
MTSTASLESRSCASAANRLCFTAGGELHSELIQFVVADGGIKNVWSALYNDSSAWPASPPWQELHVHDGAEGKSLMLVGRAGTSHWSMSVTASADAPALIFDVACRVREPPDFLGTTYRLSRTDFQVRPSRKGNAWTDLEIRPTVAGHPSLRLQVDEIAGAAPATIEFTGDQIIIRAPQPTRPQATVRWKYRYSINDAAPGD